MKIASIGAIAACLSMGACATMTRGTSEAWEVSSDPSGARVETSNGYFCEATPCAIRMPRKSQFVATLTLEGYHPATVTVTNGVSGEGGAGFAGNLLFGGPIGAVTDGLSGAMMDLRPNPAHVILRRVNEGAPQQ